MDRLSSLPEILISEILNLLPLEEAVRTTVLNSGWRHHWRSRPNIEIHESRFPSPAACLDFAAAWTTQYPLGNIDSFVLTFSSPHRDHTAALTEIIGFAIDRQSTTLELDFTPAAGNDDGAFEMPVIAGQCDRLDTLRLSSCNLRGFNIASVRTLRTLSFDNVPMSSYMVMTLLDSCPLLENFRLSRCYSGRGFPVVAPRLRSLVVENCPDLRRLVVVAENLRRFKFVGEVVMFRIVEPGLLEEADIDLMPAMLYYDEDPGEAIHKLLNMFCRARVLSVCSYTNQAISTAADPLRLPRPIAVRNLTIKTSFLDDELSGIGCLLNSCPSLQTLRFILTPTKHIEFHDNILPHEVDPEAYWGEEFRAPPSIRRGVQEVEIDGFAENDNQFRLLRFVVQHAGELRRIKLKLAREGDWEQLSRDLPRIIRAWRYVSLHQVELIIQ